MPARGHRRKSRSISLQRPFPHSFCGWTGIMTCTRFRNAMEQGECLKTNPMLFKKKLRLARMNVGGSPETPAFVNKWMSDHGVDVLGITETHLKPDGKIRVGYFAINAPRPPPEQGRNSGGVTLLFRKAGGVKLIYKHVEKNFQMVIAQVGKVKCGVVYISPKATRTETEECLRMLNTHSRGNSIIGGDWNARHKQWDQNRIEGEIN